MSKRVKLKRGKYYVSYPNGGHPSLIFRKNKKKNRYDAVVFGTTEGRHRVKLNSPISSKVKQSVVHTRPMRGTRADYGDRDINGLKVSKEDKPIIELVKRRKPQETRRYKELKEKSVKPQ